MSNYAAALIEWKDAKAYNPSGGNDSDESSDEYHTK